MSYEQTTKLLTYEQEYKFHPTRKWSLDFAWPSVKLAVELNGGTFTRGRHTRGAGVEADYEKINEAQRLGWMVLQFGSSHLSSHRKTRQVVRYVAQILQERINAQTTEQPKDADWLNYPPLNALKPRDFKLHHVTRVSLPINRSTPPKAVGSPYKSVVKKKSNVPQSKRKGVR